jgi:hypothetical protein
VSDDLR